MARGRAVETVEKLGKKKLRRVFPQFPQPLLLSLSRKRKKNQDDSVEVRSDSYGQEGVRSVKTI